MSEKISELSATLGAEEGKIEIAEDKSALEARLRRKFDLRILPILTAIFLLAFIDR